MSKRQFKSALVSSDFWMESLDRAVKTAAQAALVVLGTAHVNAWTADWKTAAGAAAGGAAISVLTSVASGAVGPWDSPSAI